MSRPRFSPNAFSSRAFALASSQASVVANYAGMLRALLPPGRLWRFAAASKLSELLLGTSDEFARVDARVGDMLEEIDPSTAIELLPDYERELDLVAAATTAERQANVVALLIRRQKFRPADFRAALALLLAQPADEVIVIERTLAYVAAIGDQREIFDFFVLRDPPLSGTYFLASAQDVISKMEPSHTVGTAIESVAFTYDDAHSLYDRDLLGGDPPKFVSVAAGATSSGVSMVLNAPSGTLAGDSVFALVYSSSSSSTLVSTALPSGWTVLSDISTSATSRTLLLQRIATGSEPSTHTFTTTSTGVVGICIAYRGIGAGVNAVSDAGATDNPASASYTAPSVLLARTTDLYIGVAWANSGSITSSAPAGTTERANANVGIRHVELWELAPPGATGDSGTKTATFSFGGGGLAAAYALHAQVMAGA